MRMSMDKAVLLIVLAVLAGCSSRPLDDAKRVFQPTTAGEQLAAGVKQYERRRYEDAAVSLQSALTTGLNDADQVTANKYLAFLSCNLERERQCRAYFTRVLELNPAFELDSAEASNSTWRNAFRAAKARRR